MPPENPLITVADIDTSNTEVAPSSGDVNVSNEQLLEAFTRLSQENSDLSVENDRLKRNAKTTEILDELITPYAKKTYWFMVGYCIFVGLFLLMSYFGCFSKDVDPSVLEILVGSTAVTVIGLVGMVLTGIFVGARRKL